MPTRPVGKNRETTNWDNWHMTVHKKYGFAGGKAVGGIVAILMSAGIAFPVTAAKAEPPVWGQSLGGSVRSGPSTRSVRIGSLPEGRRLRIIRNAGARFGGYDWFVIRYRGRIAYQWGGIMCSNRSIRGILETCAASRRAGRGSGAGTGNTGTAVRSTGRSYGGHLRAGTSRTARSLGILREGDKVFIIRDTGARWNNYNWFQIRWRGRVGYQWGGILCADTEITNIYKICGSR
jgi:hypothetical protein